MKEALPDASPGSFSMRSTVSDPPSTRVRTKALVSELPSATILTANGWPSSTTASPGWTLTDDA